MGKLTIHAKALPHQKQLNVEQRVLCLYYFLWAETVKRKHLIYLLAVLLLVFSYY